MIIRIEGVTKEIKEYAESFIGKHNLMSSVDSSADTTGLYDIELNIADNMSFTYKKGWISVDLASDSMEIKEDEFVRVTL